MWGLFVGLVCCVAVNGLQVELIPVRDAKDYSYERFRDEFMATNTPVVFRNFFKDGFKKFGDNPRQYIYDTCGHKPVYRECPTDDAEDEDHSINEYDRALIGQAWGGLKPTDIKANDIRTIGDMMREQERRKKHPELPNIYLHDASVDQLCPELLDTITLPRFFPYDFFTWFRLRRLNFCPRGDIFPALHNKLSSRVTENGEEVHAPPLRPHPAETEDRHLGYQWPSLFIGPDGTQSTLHTDSAGTTFWMAVIDGTKWWRIFREDQGPNLYPNSIMELDDKRRVYGKFAIDIFKPDYEQFPNLRKVKGWELNLTKGDLLYIPAGAPHGVKNVGDTIAYSYNLVDPSNLDYHLAVEYVDKLQTAQNDAESVPELPNGAHYILDEEEEGEEEDEAEEGSDGAATDSSDDAKVASSEARRSVEGEDAAAHEAEEEEEADLPPDQLRPPALGRVCPDPTDCPFGTLYDAETGEIVHAAVNPEEHPITFLMYFLALNATLPQPTKDYETLGEYITRNYPPNFMQLPENVEAWERTGVDEPFDEFFERCVDGDRDGEIVSKDLFDEYVSYLFQNHVLPQHVAQQEAELAEGEQEEGEEEEEEEEGGDEQGEYDEGEYYDEGEEEEQQVQP